MITAGSSGTCTLVREFLLVSTHTNYEVTPVTMADCATIGKALTASAQRATAQGVSDFWALVTVVVKCSS